MKINLITLLNFITTSLFLTLGLLPQSVYAGYLIPPPCYDACAQSSVSVRKVHTLKKHHVIKKSKKHHTLAHHRRHRFSHCNTPYCVYRYIPQHEPVAFMAAPAPSGHYINLDDCDNYVADRNTGDDNPRVYPGMDIDE